MNVPRGGRSLAVLTLCRDTALMNMTAETVIANIGSPTSGDGEGFSQFARFAAPVLAALHEARDYCESARQLVTLNPQDLLMRKLAKAPPTAFLGIRAPKEKRFLVEAAGGATISVVRKPHGAMTQNSPARSVTLTGPGDREILSETFDTDDAFETAVLLPRSSQPSQHDGRSADAGHPGPARKGRRHLERGSLCRHGLGFQNGRNPALHQCLRGWLVCPAET